MPVAMATDKQKSYLMRRYKYEEAQVKNLTKQEASDIIDRCQRAGGKLDGNQIRQQVANDERHDQQALAIRGVVEPQVNDAELDKLFGDLPETQKERERRLREDLKDCIKMARATATGLGKTLAEYKSNTPHGKWVPFLNSVCMPVRSAQRYIEIHELTSKTKSLLPAVAANASPVTHLTSISGKPEAQEARNFVRRLNEVAEGKLAEKAAADPEAEFVPDLTEEEQAQVYSQVSQEQAARQARAEPEYSEESDLRMLRKIMERRGVEKFKQMINTLVGEEIYADAF